MLGIQLRPGLYQAPRQTLRHWPISAAIVTAAAVGMAVPALQAGTPAHHLQVKIVSASDQLSAMLIPAMPAAADTLKPPPLPAPAKPDHYRVRGGDTLSEIARKVYGHSSRWPALWWVNRHKIDNPAALDVGTRLKLSGWHPDKVWLMRAAVAAIPQPVTQHHAVATSQEPASVPQGAPAPSAAVHAGSYSYSELQALWVAAGGPGWASAQAAEIAMCESGGDPLAYNASGATGLWQILGNPFPGDPRDPMTNARMAVAKFNAAGGSFSPWVCQ